MDERVKAILQSVSNTANAAKDEVVSVMQSAGKVVTEKTTQARSNIDWLRARAEQDDIFTEMGRILFAMNGGSYVPTENETPQQALDALLISAEQKQQEIDLFDEKRKEARRSTECPLCGAACAAEDSFCSVCGAKLK